MVTLASPSEPHHEPALGHEQWLALHLADRKLAADNRPTRTDTTPNVVTAHGDNQIKLTVTEHPEYGTFIHVGTPENPHLVGHRPSESHEGPKTITRSSALPQDYARVAIAQLRNLP